MSKKCKAFSISKLGLEPPDNRKAFYAGWDAALENMEKEWVGLTNEEMLYLISYQPQPLANRTAIINAVERILKKKMVFRLGLLIGFQLGLVLVINL